MVDVLLIIRQAGKPKHGVPIEGGERLFDQQDTDKGILQLPSGPQAELSKQNLKMISGPQNNK